MIRKLPDSDSSFKVRDVIGPEALQRRIHTRLALCEYINPPTHFVAGIDAIQIEAWLIESEIAHITSIFADEIFLYDEEDALLVKASFGNSNTSIIQIDYSFSTKTVAYRWV